MRATAALVLFAVTVLGLAFWPVPSPGGWGPKGCGPVGPPAFVPYPAPLVWEWRSFEDDGDQVALLRNGVQVGAYRYSGDYFRPYDRATDTWGERCRPPVQPPARQVQAVEPVEPVEAKTENFGVDWGKISHEKWTVNGKPGCWHQAHALLSGKVPDDAGLLRLTVIGPEADRKQVLADLQAVPALAVHRDKLVVKDYDPTHWAVAGAGFVTSGRPTIYLQAPDGKVLHRQDSYPGAEKLAEAIRKADPNYDPKKDPDLTKPPPPALPPLGSVPLWVWALGAVGVLVLISRARS